MITLKPTLNRRQFLVTSLCSSFALAPAMKAIAQGTPAPAPDHDMHVAVVLDEIPGKRLNTFFARYAFDTGGETPPFERVGTALIVVEAGALSLTSDRPVHLRRAGELGLAPLTDIPANGIALDVGDGALVPHNTRMGLRNEGGEPASVLMLIAYAPFKEFSYVHPTALTGMSGVTRQIIGLGTGAFEEVPAVMLIQRDVVLPSGSAFSSTYGGIEIGAIASGSARATFHSGTNWTTPAVLGKAAMPILPGEVKIPMGEIVALSSSDGYVSSNSTISWRATGPDPLVVLRGQLIPIPIFA